MGVFFVISNQSSQPTTGSQSRCEGRQCSTFGGRPRRKKKKTSKHHLIDSFFAIMDFLNLKFYGDGDL